ncbi:delta-lactam-biosynthetic de-N-acetylase [Salipaludibacillus daqingensis]|uniref:delta-lactam-biosynthetic de-N-acetylase n=1 Tax=Salipaludibacillus daqingensis TaxID=3041001 RepID=UPI0024753642|nr:delta-lactam-biosynthetic de-N-acetylase [Salipaludibacillus daqingensis]
MKVFSFVMILLLSVSFYSPYSAFAETWDNKEYQWSFKPAKNGQPATTEPYYEELIEKFGGLYIGDTSEKELYLTFDNGYENGYTEIILDLLKEKEVPATFFVTGHFITQEKELIQRMVDEGHIIGNHSYHHPSLPKVSDDRLERELRSLEQAYEEVTGLTDMRYLRPPQGTFSERSLGKTAEMGYTNVFWSLAYKDWEIDHQKGKDYAYEKIMERIHPGAVLLLHAVSSDNAEALPKVIDDLKQEGYTFKSLDEWRIKQEILLP